VARHERASLYHTAGCLTTVIGRVTVDRGTPGLPLTAWPPRGTLKQHCEEVRADCPGCDVFVCSALGTVSFVFGVIRQEKTQRRAKARGNGESCTCKAPFAVRR
jgi:hypothetical protein